MTPRNMTKKELEALLSAKEAPTARKNVDTLLSPDITRNAARLKKQREDRRQTIWCLLAVLVFAAGAVVLGVLLKTGENPQAVLRSAGLAVLGGMGVFLLCSPMLAWSADEEGRSEV